MDHWFYRDTSVVQANYKLIVKKVEDRVNDPLQVTSQELDNHSKVSGARVLKKRERRGKGRLKKEGVRPESKFTEEKKDRRL